MRFQMDRRAIVLCALVYAVAISVRDVTADSCMQRWLQLSGDKSYSVINSLRLSSTFFDEPSSGERRFQHVLPYLLKGGEALASSLRTCMQKPKGKCKEKAACTARGICKLNTKTFQYVCLCPAGLHGRFCEKDQDECRLGKAKCHGNALCKNVHGSYRCSCKPGYQGNGKACKDINECASSPCQNGGKCENLQNRFRCACPPGFSGTTCKQDFNECASNPCQHGGQCINQRNRFVCVCPVRYDGPRCQHLWLHRNFFSSMEKRMTDSALKATRAESAVIKKDIKDLKTIMELDLHKWVLVWKHSYLQVSKSVLRNARTFSNFNKPCKNLQDGWCNVPDKQLSGSAREQMIAAFHHGALVYAYKSPLNKQLGKSANGARLVSGWSMVIDKCRVKRGTRPDIFAAAKVSGIAFDKYTPNHITSNCDTVHSDYGDCRWENCRLPKSISKKKMHTQMTLAIFVR